MNFSSYRKKFIIWHSAHAIYFSFKRTSGQFNSKDFRRVMMRATQKEQAATTLKTKSIEHLRLPFLGWEPKCGDNINHTVLSRATGLESPKSLASDGASFLDSFSSIG